MAKEHFVDISAHAGPQLWQPGVRHTHPSRLLAANTGQWRMTPLQTQAEVAACISVTRSVRRFSVLLLQRRRQAVDPAMVTGRL